MYDKKDRFEDLKMENMVGGEDSIKAERDTHRRAIIETSVLKYKHNTTAIQII